MSDMPTAAQFAARYPIDDEHAALLVDKATDTLHHPQLVALFLVFAGEALLRGYRPNQVIAMLHRLNAPVSLTGPVFTVRNLQVAPAPGACEGCGGARYVWIVGPDNQVPRYQVCPVCRGAGDDIPRCEHYHLSLGRECEFCSGYPNCPIKGRKALP